MLFSGFMLKQRRDRKVAQVMKAGKKLRELEAYRASVDEDDYADQKIDKLKHKQHKALDFIRKTAPKE